jgi:hypothetical protein
MRGLLWALGGLLAVVVLVTVLIGLFESNAPPAPSADAATGTRPVAAGRPIGLPMPDGYVVVRALPEEHYAQVSRTREAAPGSVFVTLPTGTVVLPALPGERIADAEAAAANPD